MNRKLIVLSGAAILALAGFAVVAEQQLSELPPPEGLAFLGTPVTAEEVDAGRKIYQANCAWRQS
ncbi:hypothetical protein [Devosia sp. Naph2]|uniref:hypothetical protein n=1 Tax=Devosia polycyclovorans TaxID=3345148 RepID=UPI0035D0957D